MRLVVITMVTFLGVVLLLSFTLIDLGAVVKKKNARASRTVGGVPVVTGIPTGIDAQVGTIKFLFKNFPERAPAELGSFPDVSVVRALRELHGNEKNLRRRLILLDLLATRGTPEAVAYVERVRREGLPVERRHLARKAAGTGGR